MPIIEYQVIAQDGSVILRTPNYDRARWELGRNRKAVRIATQMWDVHE